MRTLGQALGHRIAILPLGGGIGHIFHLGQLPVNAQLGAYYNVLWPEDGPTCQLRAQIQLLFPKRKGSHGPVASRSRRTSCHSGAAPAC
jgi:hypothetical protein